MRHAPFIASRRATGMVAALTLAVGALVVSAGAARAEVATPPSEVVATAGTQLAYVMWSPSQDPDFVSYTVNANDLTNSANGNQSITTSGRENSTTFTTLTPGDVYTFSVVVNDASATSSPTVSNEVTPLLVTPAPTSVVATAGGEGASVSWAQSTDALVTGYLVTANDVTDPANGGQTMPGDTDREPVVSAAFGGLTVGDDYNFSVVAIDGGNVSDPTTSNDVIVLPLPAPVTNVVAAVSGGDAAITFDPSPDPAVISYTVNARDVADPTVITATSTIDTEGPLEADFGLSSFAAGDYFTFDVIANEVAGSSDPVTSNQLVYPVAPTGIFAIQGVDEIKLQWTPSTTVGVTGYIVNAIDSSVPADSSQQIVTGKVSGFVDTDVVEAQGYTFTVSAVVGDFVGKAARAVRPALVEPAGMATNLTAVVDPAESTSVDLSWTAADNPAITEYTVRVTDLTTNHPLHSPDATGSLGTSWVESDLTVGDAYSFDVEVTENGIAGTPTAETDPLVIGAPTAPTDAVATADGDSAEISWTPSTDATVTGYVITATDSTTPANGGQSVTVDPTQTTATVPGMTAGDSYTLGVAGAGVTATSAPAMSNSIVPIPVAVTDVSVLNGIDEVTLSWTPSTDPGVTGYRVTASQLNSPSLHIPPVTFASSPATMDQLLGGAPYSFVVSAVIGNVVGVPSDPTPPLFVLAPVALAPTNLAATAGVNSATVTWTKSTSPGLGNYLLTAVDLTTPGVGGQRATATSTSTSATFSDLTAGDEYWFTVQATVPGGNSAMPAISNIVVPTSVAETGGVSGTSDNGTTPTITADSTGDTTASASGTGTGTVTLGVFDTPPVPPTTGSASYFDIDTDPTSTFTSITANFCPATATTTVQWYDAVNATWTPVSDVTGPAGNPACDTVTIDATSSPSLSQLYGTVFALNAPAPTVSTLTLPTGAQSVPYSKQLAAAGGIGPLTYTATGLPDGLTLTSAGLLSGTPTGSGTSTLGVTVTDGNGSIGSAALTLTINAPVVVPPTTKATLNVPSKAAAVVGYKVSIGILVSGVKKPVLSSTKLPSGLKLTQSGDKAVISGTPTTVGVTSIVVTATGTGNVKISKTMTLSVFAAPAFVGGTTFSGSKGVVSFTVTTTGTPVALVVTVSRLPSWLHVNHGTGSLKFSGTEPKNLKSFKITVAAINPFGIKTEVVTVNP